MFSRKSLKGVVKRICSHPEMVSLLSAVERGPVFLSDNTVVSGVVVAGLCSNNSCVLFITDDSEVFSAMEGLSLSALLFPVGNCAEHLGLRLSVLWGLINGEVDVVITSSRLLQLALPSPTCLRQRAIEVKVGSRLLLDVLAKDLIFQGYVMEKIVTNRGEFSVRGSVVDIFPPNAPSPYRIGVSYGRASSIRLYGSITQRSYEDASQVVFLPMGEDLDIRDCTLWDYIGRDSVIIVHEASGLYIGRGKDIDRLKHSALCSPYQTPFYSINSRYGDCGDGLLDRVMGGAGSLTITVNSVGEEASAKASIGGRQGVDVVRSSLKDGVVIGGHSPFVMLPYSKCYQSDHVVRREERNQFNSLAQAKRQSQYRPMLFSQFEPGSYVVHLDHGVGRYKGVVVKPPLSGGQMEFMAIEYASGFLYVPLSNPSLVTKYIGNKQPKLDRLGSKRWKRSKSKAKASIKDYAKDLLHAQAIRELRGGYTYPSSSSDLLQFEREVPFDLTEDQCKAIHEIYRDMESNKAMDRLLCGDAGYGKTEVAMRAAFKAVKDGGKQVVLFAPTTFLAMQHYETFVGRMERFGVRIALLSRFTDAKELLGIREMSIAGELDVLISTHRLISSFVLFKDIGLIIIDEEQKLGLRIKESLKKIKYGVDCLTISATPLPRTIHMALVNAKDLSTLTTPPVGRVPVEVCAIRRDMGKIAGIIRAEVDSGGQVYYIHNRIQTIHRAYNELKAVFPGCTIGISHSKLDSDQLNRVFHLFKDGMIDILVSTTIIANGIDIPNANIIIIDGADKFGLAELYQLRGRVGRSNRKAYAYLIINGNQPLGSIPHKRIKTLIESPLLGSGLYIALNDLEMRGVGDILGVKQSGNLATVGFPLYCKLLSRAIKALQAGRPVPIEEPTVECGLPSYIPESYISDQELRVLTYLDIGSVESIDELDSLADSVRDRFGEPPVEVENLYILHLLRVLSNGYSFSKLSLSGRRLELQLSADPKIIVLDLPSLDRKSIISAVEVFCKF